MKIIVSFGVFMLLASSVFGQYEENKEKFTILGGLMSSGTEFVFWSDNVYGGNFQIIYDALKIQEGSIGIKASGVWAEGFSGYYGGPNLRIGSKLFLDFDAMFGYSSISNKKLLSTYPKTDHYSGGAFVGNIGFGYRFANNPLLVRFAITSHFPFQNVGINYGYNLQLGYRL